MKRLKCIKCDGHYKDREDPEDTEIEKTLCWNCKYVWKVLGLVIHSIPTKINRDITIDIRGIQIRKKPYAPTN